MERDLHPAEAEVVERQVVTVLPDITLKELVTSFHDVLARSEMFAHHHVQLEALSVRERMTTVLSRLQSADYLEFTTLFTPTEGRMGVVVTFLAVLELIKESLIDVVQAEPYAAIHIKAAAANRTLHAVEDTISQDTPES